MYVSELMTADVVTTTPATTLRDVARTLVQHRISGMPVCDESGALVGVISEGDILFKERGRIESHGGVLGWLLDEHPEWELDKNQARTVGEAMTSPPITTSPIASVAEAARLMTEEGVNRLPVVGLGDKGLVGILTRSDLIRAFIRPDHVVAAEIRDDVLRRVLWLSPGIVEIDVSDGEVALSGALDTEAEAQVLEKLVAKVPGVVAVHSTVTVDPERTPA